MADVIEYRGFVITPHYGEVDRLHYHWGQADEFGRVTVPMNCQGPAAKAVREMYGANLGGCDTVNECCAEIDHEIALCEQHDIDPGIGGS